MSWEIEQQTGGFRVRKLALPGEQQQPWGFIPCHAVKEVRGLYQPGFGTRQPDNIRKNPIRQDDLATLKISFHDQNETSPFEEDLLYVNNQPTWTPDLAGLNQAVSDITSWCGGGVQALINIEAAVQNIDATLSGNTETPSTVENTTSGGAGSTTAGVKGFSILFEGSGGTLGGVAVDSGYSTSKSATLGNELGSQAYVVPNVADVAFPNSPRVLIEYVS